MSKNLDETVHLQFKKREEWIQEVKGERLQGTAEGRSSTSHQANSSATSFLERNESPGTRYRLVVKEERENSSC